MFYSSKSMRGFFSDDIHGNAIPSDAVQVSDALHASLLAGESGGKVIDFDSEPPTLVAPPPPSAAQIEASKVKTVQMFIDGKAQSLGYDNIYTAVSYADEPAVPKFQLEGQALRAWRSVVWAKANEILAAVTAGTQPIPSDSDLIAALPVFTPPSP